MDELKQDISQFDNNLGSSRSSDKPLTNLTPKHKAPISKKPILQHSPATRDIKEAKQSKENFRGKENSKENINSQNRENSLKDSTSKNTKQRTNSKTSIDFSDKKTSSKHISSARKQPSQQPYEAPIVPQTKQRENSLSKYASEGPNHKESVYSVSSSRTRGVKGSQSKESLKVSCISPDKDTNDLKKSGSRPNTSKGNKVPVYSKISKKL